MFITINEWPTAVGLKWMFCSSQVPSVSSQAISHTLRKNYSHNQISIFILNFDPKSLIHLHRIKRDSILTLLKYWCQSFNFSICLIILIIKVKTEVFLKSHI